MSPSQSDETPIVNPPYEVPPGPADAPPAVPPDVNMTQETQDYLDGFVKSPDPRDPVDTVITDGELSPPSSPPVVPLEADPADPFGGAEPEAP